MNNNIGLHYERRIDKIIVRPTENNSEYHRQYYWLRKTGETHPRMRAEHRKVCKK